MATFYTAAVQSGDVTDFAAFAMQCARAMGVAITLRDEPAGVQLPDSFAVDDYYVKAEEDARADLDAAMAMTLEEATEECERSYRKACEYWAERAKENVAQRTHYEAMLAKVLAWNPPTPDHVGLKQFMESQLRESIDFDCSYEPVVPVKASPESWLDTHRAECHRNLVRSRKSLAEEMERTAKRNDWIREFKASLKTA